MMNNLDSKDLELIRIAKKRMQNYDKSKTISQEELYEELHIDKDEIDKLSKQIEIDIIEIE